MSVENLINGLEEHGYPHQIPDCGRLDLAGLFVHLGFKTGVEVGIYKGHLTAWFAKAGLDITGVDPFLIYEDNAAGSQRRQESLYREAQHNIAAYPNARIIRKSSMEGVKDFADRSLDFVYIDANHGFKYVAEDLWEWSKKVKSGGIISGHDFTHIERPDPYCWHVQWAVSGYVKAMKIGPWYLLGRFRRRHGEQRDKDRSYMWFNP